MNVDKGFMDCSSHSLSASALYLNEAVLDTKLFFFFCSSVVSAEKALIAFRTYISLSLLP